MILLKKTAYNKLVAEVNSIDTSGFVLKTKYETDKSETENKIPNTSDLVKKTGYNAKITEIQSKIPDVNSVAAKTALITVENEIPNISKLVMTQKLLKLKTKLLVMIIINILQLQSLIL